VAESSSAWQGQRVRPNLGSEHVAGYRRTGNVGRNVVEHFLARGEKVRALVRDPQQSCGRRRCGSGRGGRDRTDAGCHAGKAYPLSGPQSLAAAEQVTRIGEALGRPLAYQELPPAVAREQMSRFMPPFILDTLFEQWEASVGHPAPLFDTVEQLTGRPARTFAQWAADHTADFP
jgi:uncharacterized protein YbjT (DUF2867 family)